MTAFDIDGAKAGLAEGRIKPDDTILAALVAAGQIEFLRQAYPAQLDNWQDRELRVQYDAGDRPDHKSADRSDHEE